MSEEVTKIINTLCEKLGVAANILVPEMAKYNIARLAFLTAIQIALFVIVAIITVKIARYILKNDDSDMEDKLFGILVISIIPVVVMVALCVRVMDDATSLVGWLASPTASAVMEITNMIK